MADEGGLREARDLIRCDGVCGLADEVGRRAPATAEGERDIVFRDSRSLGNFSRGLRGNREGV